MKRKLLLAFAISALLMLVFAISIFAAEIPEWTETIRYETGDNAIAYKEGFDTTSRVMLSNGDGTYSTYPSNYIIKGTDAVFSVSYELDFTALKAASGNSSYSYSSVIRFEMPTGYTSVEDRAFKNDKGFKSLQTVKVCEGVTTMGINIFYDSTTIVEVELPNTLETIGTGFAYNSSLEKINIPKNLTAIPKESFRECTSLKTVDFSQAEKLESIGYWAFYKSSSLESAILPEGLTYIDELAFKLSGVKEVYLPSTLETIKKEAFMSCASLTTIDSRSKIIGPYMFKGCIALTSVDLTTAETIQGRAFQNDSTSTPAPCDFIFGDSLKVIERYAFQYSGVKEVVIPATLHIDYNLETTDDNDINIFEGCQHLKKVTYKAKVLGAYMFTNCLSLETVIIDGTEIIASKAFYIKSGNTSSLTTVTLPNTLVEIGEYAFIRNAITSLEIPASLTTVGQGAFRENKSLQSVVFLGSTMGKDMFYDCSNLSKLVITEKLTTYGGSALNNVSTTFATFYTGTDYSRIKSLCVVSRITNAKYSTYESYAL